MQCYGIEIIDNSINVLEISINKSVFPNGIRPYKFKFSVFFHARNQILRARPTLRSVWARRKRQFGYIMSFKIASVDILKRRNKSKQSCVDERYPYDNTIIQQHLETVGCSNIYQKVTSDLPFCTNENDKKLANIDINTDKISMFNPPCRSAEKIDHTYEEIDAKRSFKVCKDCFAVSLGIHDRRFKEITQIKALNIQALVGNAGAYVGLFCGYTLLQLPDMIIRVYGSLKNFILHGSLRKERNLFRE